MQGVAAPATEFVEEALSPLPKLTGLDFLTEPFGRDFLVAPTVLSLKSYGGVRATVKLDRETTGIRVLFKSRSQTEGYPYVTLLASDGKTTHSILRGELVRDGTVDIEKPLALPPGTYVLSIEYSSATVDTPRPALDIHQIEFR